MATALEAEVALMEPRHEQRMLAGIQDQALLAFENRLRNERVERQAAVVPLH